MKKKKYDRSRNSHPSKNIKGTLGGVLDGKKVVLCVTGSVAAYKSIDFARLLMRYGAEVFPVSSESTSLLLNPNFLKWATGNDVVDKLTGDMEHIALADFYMSDIIVVYPCTANTIGKFANGVDDTPITSILSVALGSGIPIFIAPAMHEALYKNPLVAENIERLKNQGVIFLEPIILEGKAKIISPDQALEVILEFIKKKSNKILADKNILVTSGSTVEYIDPIRIVTNLSSGKMGNAIVKEALASGASVTHVIGYAHYNDTSNSGVKQSNLKTIHVTTSDEMYKTTISEISSKRYDIAILAAAVSDFKPQHTFKKKINSNNSDQFSLNLLPTKKIINDIKTIDKKIFLVGFKAYHDVSDTYLVNQAIRKLKECKGDLIVANDVGRKDTSIGSDFNEVFIISRDKPVVHLSVQRKESIAKRLLEIIISAN